MDDTNNMRTRRRDLIKAGAAASTLAAGTSLGFPALAQSARRIKIGMASGVRTRSLSPSMA